MTNTTRLYPFILASILLAFTLGAYAEDKVVVIPLAADEPTPDCSPGFIAATARLDIRQISTSGFASSGISEPYTCNGDEILAKIVGSSRLQIMFDDGIIDSSIGSRFAKFGTITTNNDLIFPISSQLFQCSISIPPTILCLSFDFRDNTGANTLPNDSMYLVVYGR